MSENTVECVNDFDKPGALQYALSRKRRRAVAFSSNTNNEDDHERPDRISFVIPFAKRARVAVDPDSTDDVCANQDCDSPESVMDPKEGVIVCRGCGYVIKQGLFFEELTSTQQASARLAETGAVELKTAPNVIMSPTTLTTTFISGGTGHSWVARHNRESKAQLTKSAKLHKAVDRAMDALKIFTNDNFRTRLRALHLAVQFCVTQSHRAGKEARVGFVMLGVACVLRAAGENGFLLRTPVARDMLVNAGISRKIETYRRWVARLKQSLVLPALNAQQTLYGHINRLRAHVAATSMDKKHNRRLGRWSDDGDRCLLVANWVLKITVQARQSSSSAAVARPIDLTHKGGIQRRIFTPVFAEWCAINDGKTQVSAADVLSINTSTPTYLFGDFQVTTVAAAIVALVCKVKHMDILRIRGSRAATVRRCSLCLLYRMCQESDDERVREFMKLFVFDEKSP